MKSNIIIRFAALLLAALTLFTCFTACDKADGGDGTQTSAPPVESPQGSDAGTTAAPNEALPPRWDNAVHKEDKTFGEGAKTFRLEVVADGHSVTFTVKSDEEFLGAALLTHGIITGENGPYGLYITAVNGMTADYDKDRAYWAISKNGEYLMTGVDTTPIEEGAHYELTYTKG